MNPNDVSIYKWIGDLLYEGRSYMDALKSYGELGNYKEPDVTIMMIKCMLRVGSYQEVGVMFKGLEKEK